MKTRSGSIRQGGLTHHKEDFYHEELNYPVVGVVLDVRSSDDPLNLRGNSHQDGRASGMEAVVLVIRGETDTPWVLPNVFILPRGGTGQDDYSEELPTPTTGTIDGSTLPSDVKDVNPVKLNGDWCVAPGTKVLCADLVWRAIETLRVGDEVIGFDEELRGTKLRSSFVEATKTLTKPCYKITTDRGEVISSEDHMWVIRRGSSSGASNGVRTWTHSKDVKTGDLLSYFTDPWDVDDSYDGAYLAGFLDGEGYVSGATADGGSGRLGFGQNPGPLLDHVLSLLQQRKLEWSDFQGTNSCRKIEFTGSRSALRAAGMLRPRRLLPKVRSLWEGRSPHSKAEPPARVLGVECCGERTVVALQTTTRTFIADGYLSHNCVVQFVGGHINQPIMTSWFPHPENRRDPLTKRTNLGNLAQRRRLARRFQGTRFVVTSEGSIMVDTSEANKPLEADRRTRTKKEKGGDIRITVKKERELEVNFNPPVFNPDEPDFLWPPTRAEQTRDEVATRLLANQDFIKALAGKLAEIIAPEKVKIQSDDFVEIQGDGKVELKGGNAYIGTQGSAIENFVLGQQLKLLLVNILNALINHKHPTGVGPSGPPDTPEINQFTAALATVNADLILSNWIFGQKLPP